MKFFTSLHLTTYALFAGLLAAATAHAQDNHFVAVSEPGHQQPTGISFAGASAANNSLELAAPALKLSAVPAPAESAAFYNDSHKDLSQSLAWMLDLNAAAPTYWNLYTESRIRLKMKDYAGAKAAAEKSQQLALNYMPASREYVALSAEVLAQASALTKP